MKTRLEESHSFSEGSDPKIYMLLLQATHRKTFNIPAEPVSDALIVSGSLVAGEAVWTLSIHYFTIAPAAHFHVFSLLLIQDLVVELVKHCNVHRWPDTLTSCMYKS